MDVGAPSSPPRPSADLLLRKKSLKQRRELLLKAWPRMSNTHRPDFESLRSRKQRITAAHACRPEACLWPYVNLEDLQQRNLLLHFLNSRGRHLPETFRPADFHAAHLGDGWNRALDFAQSFEEYCCPDHYVEDFEDDDDDICMLFEEKHSPVRYGRLITQHAKCLPSEKFKYLRRAKEGLLSLEIQVRALNASRRQMLTLIRTACTAFFCVVRS